MNPVFYLLIAAAFEQICNVYDAQMTLRGVASGLAVEGNTFLVGPKPTARAVPARRLVYWVSCGSGDRLPGIPGDASVLRAASGAAGLRRQTYPGRLGVEERSRRRKGSGVNSPSIKCLHTVHRRSDERGTK
jgi:hypothetical protein